MRIPHTVPKNAYDVYKPSRTTLDLVGEDARPIKAENITWDENIPPTLVTLCVHSLVETFQARPVLEILPPQALDLLLETLPTDLPVKLTVPLIKDGVYWKRSAFDRWKTELDIVFGERNCGMDFKWSFFRFAVSDCHNIGSGMEYLEHITVLRLHRCVLDDIRLAALLQHLVKNKTLIELDFSHCLVGDAGAMALGKLLQSHPTLNILNLCNNVIGLKGVDGLAYGMSQRGSCPLKCLNLRLNSMIKDEGVVSLCAALALMVEGQLMELNLAGCGITLIGALTIGEMLARNQSLRILDLSNNHLEEKGGKYLECGLKHNQTLLQLDLRVTDILQENALNITLDLQKNKELHKKLQKKLLKTPKSRVYFQDMV